jgi:release factor glutamine methyltransferase
MPISIRAELSEATQLLSAAGVASPRVEAELLLAYVVGRSRGHLVLLDSLGVGDRGRLTELITRRAQGVPLQHLTGSAPFRQLELLVGPGVFIPRPETELIVELAERHLDGSPVVVDLCAGSGAIALAVVNEHPQAKVYAVERSDSAVEWLKRNADARAAAGDQPIEIVQMDVADLAAGGRLRELAGTVDVVLSNPPYVPTRVRSELAVEISHDPDEAVFAGNDGLDLIPAVLGAAARLLRPGGFLAIEHDDSHAQTLPRLLESSGSWQTVSDHVDLAGRPRFATAIRRR